MVRIARALARGFDDALTPAGVRLFGATLLLLIATELLVNTFLDGLSVAVPGGRLVLGFATTLPLAPGTAVWLLVGLWVLGSWLLVVFVRTLFRDGSDGIHPEDVIREGLPATLRMTVATGIGGVLVLAGLAFGIGPGVLLAAHLLFVPVFLAVEDAGLLTAVVKSWQVAAEHRVRVLAFTTVVTLLLGAIAVAGALATSLDPWLEFLLGISAIAFVCFVSLAVVVDVYRQHGERGRRSHGARHGLGAGAL